MLEKLIPRDWGKKKMENERNKKEDYSFREIIYACLQEAERARQRASYSR